MEFAAERFVSLHIEDAMLSQVLHDDLLSVHVVVRCRLHGAILSIADAILTFVRRVTVGASPGNKHWLEIHRVHDRFDVLSHVFDEVQ